MPIPRDPSFDGTIALLREGYDFISNRCNQLGSDVFATRLMLHTVICMRGREAAEMFYGRDRFTRNGAIPQMTLRLLQDKGSVQSLDGEAYRRRKAMFLAILLDQEQIERLRIKFRQAWLDELDDWQQRDRIVLFDAANLVLTRAVADWLDIPPDKDRAELCQELSGMIENAGGFGPSAWLALLRRRRTERYLRSIVTGIRVGALSLPSGNPLRTICEHLDSGEVQLDAESAAVEIINLMRPVVAVGRFIMFAATALYENPSSRAHFVAGDDDGLEAFTEEVRRLYPFFPFVGGRVVEPFEWRGHSLRIGDWVLLDLYGTNQDERRFPQPQHFHPDRGLSWKSQGYDFVPQGGGTAELTHRCPGEAMTVGLMMDAIQLLTRSMTYEVPEQNLAISKARIPARPASGFIIQSGGLPTAVRNSAAPIADDTKPSAARTGAERLAARSGAPFQ